MMAAGLEHSLALTESGDLYSFGDNLRYSTTRGTVLLNGTEPYRNVMFMSDEIPQKKKCFPKKKINTCIPFFFPGVLSFREKYNN